MRASLLRSVLSCMLLAVVCVPVVAQTLNTDRAYEHVVLPPFQLAEFSSDQAAINELHLFAYRAGQWREIPFQIDERGLEINADGDTTLNSYFPNAKDGMLDDSDELLFMAQDAGERAAANEWFDDANAKKNTRYEIRVTDPLTQRLGYVYLYRSNTLAADPLLPTYVKYAAGPIANPAADTVRGVSYSQGHTSNGIPNYLTVSPAFGGTGADFIDRLKLRIRATVPVFGNQTINENDNLVATAGGIRTVQGRVRVIRQVRERLQIFLFGTPIPVDTLAISLFFYPYSAQLAGEINLTSTLGARLLRASFDFDPNVSNQAWHNQNVGPRIVTGTSGTLSPTEAQIVLLPKRNWFTMGSIHGSLTGIFSMDPIANTTQQFYFCDTQSSTACDGTPDTGDNRSYGDTGFKIESASAIVARFQLGMSAFYLKPGLTRNEAAALSANAETPVQITTNAQLFDNVAPTRVNDLRVCFTTDTSAVLSLTAPSDIGSSVKSYEVGYMIRASTNDTTWYAAAQKTTQLPAPAAPGTLQLLAINGLQKDSSYCFLLRSFDDFGNASALSNIACDDIVSVAEQEVSTDMPQNFMLAQSYPNPFSLRESATLIRYELAQAQVVPVVLRVYDLLGHEVRRLVKAQQPRGSYRVQWDGRDESGMLVPAGIYFYELRAGDLRQVKKMVVVR